jgi:hypothetical protein
MIDALMPGAALAPAATLTICRAIRGPTGTLKEATNSPAQRNIEIATALIREAGPRPKARSEIQPPAKVPRSPPTTNTTAVVAVARVTLIPE